MKSTKIRQLLSLCVLVSLFTLGACRPAASSSAPPSSSPASALQKGVTLTPRSFQPGDFTDFFVKAKQAGTIVT